MFPIRSRGNGCPGASHPHDRGPFLTSGGGLLTRYIFFFPTTFLFFLGKTDLYTVLPSPKKVRLRDSHSADEVVCDSLSCTFFLGPLVPLRAVGENLKTPVPGSPPSIGLFLTLSPVRFLAFPPVPRPVQGLWGPFFRDPFGGPKASCITPWKVTPPVLSNLLIF